MFRKCAAATAFWVLMSAVTVQAQIVGDDVTPNVQAPWNTAANGTQALRAPGRLIDNARATYRAAHSATIIHSRFGPEITEQAPETTLEQDVRIAVIETVFESLNSALEAWLLALQLGAGIPPGGDSATNGLSDLLGNITSPI